MPEQSSKVVSAIFRFIIARRWWVVTIHALLLVPAIYYALRVGQDNSLDRLIVKSDPTYVASRAFAKVFAGGEYALLLFEAEDPYRPEVVRRLDALEQTLARLPRVNASSVVSIYRRAKAGFEATPAQAEALRRFATGTDLFRKQGLVGPRQLAIALVLDVHSGAERQQTLDAIDRHVRPLELAPAPFRAVRKVGQPYVNAYLDNDTRAAALRYFPIFGVFVITLIIVLYRSLRALVAFLVCLAASAALTVGAVGIVGAQFTIVSALVPMTVLITCTATLVYIHSRFVDHPPGRSVEEHHIFALGNKLLACSASLFATAVGFAALAVSKIRPIREMGLAVAVGMVFIWIVAFTLFPALQRILRTPTAQRRKVAGEWMLRLAAWLPGFTYRHRYSLVGSALLCSAAGAVALFGFPGLVKPMYLETNAIEYVSRTSDLYRYTKQFERDAAGLAVTEVWLKGPLGAAGEPDVVRGLDAFMGRLERDRRVGAAMGLPTVLRIMRYVGGKGDRLPADREELEAITDSLDELLAREPLLQGFVEKTNMAQTHVMVITPTVDYEGYQALDALIRSTWQATAAQHPALKGFTLQTVGQAPLAAKTSHHLVPTLVESFALTVVIILGTFVLIFRSGPARLMAMIPSLFAILMMFGIMRLTGMYLNVATIIIASTVLGATENDQIHFFYHFLERRKDGTTEQSLRHTLTVAGRAIFFATLINACGFLAFALAELPPIRQFGTLTSLAFVLSMLADFLALPAALWIVFRARPDDAQG